MLSIYSEFLTSLSLFIHLNEGRFSLAVGYCKNPFQNSAAFVKPVLMSGLELGISLSKLGLVSLVHYASLICFFGFILLNYNQIKFWLGTALHAAIMKVRNRVL